MHTSLLMRTARQDDLPQLLPLYGQLGEDDGSILSLEEGGVIMDRMRTYPDYRIRVAEFHGILVGTYAILVMDNLGHRGAKSAVVEDVVVDWSVRGQGVGKRMMEDAMEVARECACYKIVLSSNRNRLAAHRFYEALGFEPHGFSYALSLEAVDA